MANKEHTRMLIETIARSGANGWNAWRAQNPEVIPDLSEAEIIGAISANLSGADFSRANLTRARFDLANLSKASFHGASLGGSELSQSILTGANLSGTNLIRSDLMATDLNDAILSGANLSLARLSNSKLVNSDLSGADLSSVDFSDSDLTGADLTSAFASRANFSRAKLTNANLTRTILLGANFFGADLKNADLSEAEIGSTLFVNTDLSSIKGLDTVHHFEPSSIGTDTIYRSKGNIPEIFLRGAGLPESFISYMASLTAKSFEFYSCFISYSAKDEAFAGRIYRDLQAVGVRCWFAPQDLRLGQIIRSQIDESIRLYDKLLLILSKESVGSLWVKHEVEMALAKEEQHKKTVLFPIRLDDSVLQRKDFWAQLIKTRQIGDFHSWKDHDSYQKAFSRLLRDLTITAAVEAGGAEQPR